MQESGYIFGGVEGESIFIFLSRRLSFFSKPDVALFLLKCPLRAPNFLPPTPAMVVWNHMNERMIPKAPFWGVH